MVGDKREAFLALLLLGAALSACKKDDDPPEPVSTTSTPVASTQAAASPPPATSAEAAPKKDIGTCKVESEKVLGKGANRRTGLTTHYLADGRSAVGVALGNMPYAVIVTNTGNVSLRKITVEADEGIGKPIDRSEGSRDLQRVTPFMKDGKLRALVDYRDKHNDPKRHIYCGPAESAKAILEYDGKPLLMTDADEPPEAEEAPESPAKQPKEAAGKSERGDKKAADSKKKKGKKGKKKKDEKQRAKKPKEENTPADAAADIEQAASLKGPVREIRDCRSFVDESGDDVWAMGSQLVGTPQPDGSMQWKMAAITQSRPGGPEAKLHEVDLGSDPDKLHTFEAPVAHTLKGGTTILTARYKGALLMWTLDGKKRKTGFSAYSGGYPTLPRFVPEGPNLRLIVSRAQTDERFRLATALFSTGAELPDILTFPDLDVGILSVAEPYLTTAGDQKWLSFQNEQRRKAELYVVPVDARLQAVGRAYRVAPNHPAIYESVIFGLRDGSLLALFITSPSSGETELVSQKLTCQVKR